VARVVLKGNLVSAIKRTKNSNADAKNEKSNADAKTTAENPTFSRKK
jgi:hypothetical protein